MDEPKDDLSHVVPHWYISVGEVLSKIIIWCMEPVLILIAIGFLSGKESAPMSIMSYISARVILSLVRKRN